MKHIKKESLRDLSIAVRKSFAMAWQGNRRTLLVLLVLSMTTAVIPFGISGVNALLINHLVRTAGTGVITSGLIGLLVLSAIAFFTRGALYAYMSYRSRLSWLRLWYLFETTFTKKVVSLDIATHEDSSFQDKWQIVREHGTAFAPSNFVETTIMNLQNLVGFVVASVIVLIADWRLFLLMMIASIPRLYAEIRHGESLWSIWQSQSSDKRHYGEVRRHTETVDGIQELQTYQTTPFFLRRQMELLKIFNGTQAVEEKSKLRFLIFAEILFVAAIATVLIMFVREVLSGTLLIGTFVFLFGAVMSLNDSISGFFLAIARQHRDAKIVKSYFDILAMKPRVQSGMKELSLEKAPVIEFRNVSFAYPSKPHEFVLKDFSLTIQGGEKLALVGVNGAGKSTLIKLLFRFYDPVDGDIFINGVNLKEIALNSWYEHLALLTQDYADYKMPVGKVIGLGKLNGREHPDKVASAAKRTQANIFIEEWEFKYEQQLGVEFPEGINPSKGQNQKIALSRALYRDALVTVLDEPTAHVDAEAEQHIFDQLEKELRSDQTLICISHRFSTVRSADRICVVKDGKVHELGSHEELMAFPKGVYKELFKKQAAGYM